MTSRVIEMPSHHKGTEHQHPWGQLAYASQGIMRVELPGASFTIPPERALWIPKFTPHIISTRYGLSFRSLYIDNALSINLPTDTTAIVVDKLLRELILQVTRWGNDYEIDGKKERLMGFLLDQVEDAQQTPLYLNMPTDKRLLKMTSRLSRHPADNTSLEQWSSFIGATPRTINRLFNKETNMGFLQWRQRLRILYSLDKIERGDNLVDVAVELGYESSSAFITMFKKHLGTSPKRYFKESQDKPLSLSVYSTEEPS